MGVIALVGVAVVIVAMTVIIVIAVTVVIVAMTVIIVIAVTVTIVIAMTVIIVIAVTVTIVAMTVIIVIAMTVIIVIAVTVTIVAMTVTIVAMIVIIVIAVPVVIVIVRMTVAVGVLDRRHQGGGLEQLHPVVACVPDRVLEALLESEAVEDHQIGVAQLVGLLDRRLEVVRVDTGRGQRLDGERAARHVRRDVRPDRGARQHHRCIRLVGRCGRVGAGVTVVGSAGAEHQRSGGEHSAEADATPAERGREMGGHGVTIEWDRFPEPVTLGFSPVPDR